MYLPGQALPYHALSGGDIVLLSRGPKPGPASLEAVVVDTAGRWLRVAVAANLADGVQARSRHATPAAAAAPPPSADRRPRTARCAPSRPPLLWPRLDPTLF